MFTNSLTEERSQSLSDYASLIRPTLPCLSSLFVTLAELVLRLATPGDAARE